MGTTLTPEEQKIKKAFFGKGQKNQPNTYSPVDGKLSAILFSDGPGNGREKLLLLPPHLRRDQDSV
jgi:hypothetical protein